MSDLWNAIENGNSDDVLRCIQSNPALVVARQYGETPLHLAASQRKLGVAKLLLQHGADVNAHGNNGRTALHYAAQMGEFALADLLIENGAEMERLDDFGFTPLFVAARGSEREFANHLIERGAVFDFHSAVCLGDVNRVRELVELQPQVIDECTFRSDLLPDAVYANSPEIVELLLNSKSIDVNSYGLSGEPALVAAVSRNDYNPEIVQRLIDHGANPKVESSSGDTAITRARSVGEQGLVQWLLKQRQHEQGF